MSNYNYDICVLGLGYIGLPTSSIFATRGKEVLGVDVREEVVETINRGEIHIEEPDLDIMVKGAVQTGALVASVNPDSAAAYILAVPTPFVDEQDYQPDLSFVESATRSLASVISDRALVILESTSPVGTTEKVRNWLEDECKILKRSDIDLSSILYVHCPERILPGQMLAELVTNDRIVGGLTPESAQKAEELYRTFCTGAIIRTDARTAEMVKLTENASRDCQIAFANELSVICEKMGLNVWEVIRLANHHPRVNILKPGAGVGGHCIAVDPWFIISSSDGCARVMKAAREVNNAKPDWVVDKVRRAVDRIKGAKVGIFGITFKPNVDDIRNSPALEIAKKVAGFEGVELRVFEPNVESLPQVLAKGSVSFQRGVDGVSDLDVVVALVAHREFEELDQSLLEERIFINACGLFV